jgi:amino acid transporter
VQNVASLVKVASVAFLAILPFVALRREPFVASAPWPSTIDQGTIAGIGTALAAIMWAYDGWGNATVVAEEVRNPARNLPRALVGGVLLLTILYTGANLAFHITLPWNEIIHAKIPAAAVTERLLPGVGYKLLLAMLLISVFGALNGNILVGPRVLFAVGRDHRRLALLGRVGNTRATPGYAIASVCVWAMVLVGFGDLSGEKPLYDALTNYCVFGGSIFYLTAVLAIFVLRLKRPDAQRPYRTWGYPLVPAVFVIFYVFFLGSMFLGNTYECTVGLTLIVAGFVAYLWLNRA